MLPSRFMSGQSSSSSIRKSRLEVPRPSYLPKPRNAGSIDRLSQDRLSHRPSNARSSSAEPARATLSAARLSREASATKIPMNRRSRSQQGESRYGQNPMTPLRSSQYRPTTTPVRTPSEDRSTRSWQSSLDRALAFVTMKDQRPLSNPAWQRSECHRAQEALASRGFGDGGGSMALIRPLTITRFVDIVGALLNTITKDSKLNNDNYVTKVPHIAKLLLYPGVVSKSWLKTVNTLHAFPHALGLICYLLDLVGRIEMPVEDEWMYLEKDDLAMLRRDFLRKCWTRFQEPGSRFDDLDEEYLHNLEQLLGNDDEKIAELQEVIKKYELCLEDEEEKAARADEARRATRRAALLEGLRAERGARVEARAAAAAARERRAAVEEGVMELDAEIEKANAELNQLRRELQDQQMSVEERTRLLDGVDYANRVQDSKRALADQINKMVVSKESELALWQKRSLASCMEYNQALIRLSARLPHLASLAVDEKDLMNPSCGEAVLAALDTLKAQVSELSSAVAAAERARGSERRRRAQLLDETRANIKEMKSALQREQEILTSQQSAEIAAASAYSEEEAETTAKLEELRIRRGNEQEIEAERQFWEAQGAAWKEKISTLQKYVEEKRSELTSALSAAKQQRAALVCAQAQRCIAALDRVDSK